MKIAVYSIALNEAQFVQQWADSAADADYLLIADTGSQDETVSLAKDNGVNVIEIGVKPWRFDDARNASLAAIPLDIDYCIALDMDEVLLPGWRKEMEKAFEQGFTRPRYEYTWSWNEDGSPGLIYGGDKIHTRSGYRWKHPVHEVLVSTTPEISGWIDLKIHHHADNSKSRGQYLPLLEQAVREDPHDDRNAHYLAREYYFRGMLEKASAEFQRHLELPTATWAPERSTSMRYLSQCDLDRAEYWLLRSAAEAPDRREPWVDMADYYRLRGEWSSALASACRALAIKERPLEYLCEASAWGSKPYDIAALASYYLGDIEAALAYGQEAVIIDPTDSRLVDNLAWYSGSQGEPE